MRFHKMKKDLSISLRLLLILGVFIAIPSLAFKSETAGSMNLSPNVAYAESSSATLPTIMAQKGSPAASLNVSGKVLYYQATGNDTIPVGCSAITTPTLCSPNAAKPVPRVSMTATVGTPAVPSTMTDLTGAYTLSGFGADNPPGTNSYTVTPSKTAQQDVNGITSLDAGLIGIFAAGGGTPFTTCKTLAGDSSGNGSITSLDAGQVGRFAAGLSTGIGNTGQWRFLANCVSYTGMVTDQTSQNYTAILIGDVNNSWQTPASSPQTLKPNSITAVGVSLPTLLVHQNAGVISVPISVSGLSGEISYDLNVAFNSAILTPANPPFDKTGTISANATVSSSTTTGNLRLGAFDPAGFSTTPGILINLKFNVVGTNGQSTTLTFAPSSTPPPLASPGVFFDDVPPMTITNGSVTIGPTAVTFEDCKITAYDNGSTLEWQTGQEGENLGFNIYREEGGKRTRINANLIAGSALKAKSDLSTGEAYAWWDENADTGASYWIEDIDLNGKSSWHGPFYANYVGGNPPERSRAALLSNLGNRAKEDTSRVVDDRSFVVNDKNAFKASGRYALSAGAKNSFASEPSVKISVKDTGWYRVTQPELVAAGLNPNANPATLQLYVDGREIPISVTDNGNVFNSQSAIEFYATALNTQASDTHVYWLVAGNQAGLRVPLSKNDGAQTATHNFVQTVERKDRTLYFSALLNGDTENFFGAVITPTPVDQPITLPHLIQTDATMEIALQGVSRTTHRVSAMVNGLVVGEVNFDAQSRGVGSFSVPGSFLRDGSNTVTLLSQNGQQDVSVVDYVRVSYTHSLTADNDYLSFTANGRERVTIDGFLNRDIRVFDVTDPNAVKELTGFVNNTRNRWSTSFTSADAGVRNFVATTQTQAKHGVSITANQPSNWRATNSAADLLIIAKGDLMSAIEPLKAARQQEGYRVAVVDVEDVYDEFNFGNKSPQAIKDFLAYARSNWSAAPRFVLFVGDATFDPKDYLGFGAYDGVPTKLVDTAEIETSSDDWFADFNNDGIADIPVGRLPVRNASEASSVISKLLSYGSGTESNSALLVSDQPDIWNFEQENSNLHPALPISYQITDIKRRELGDQQARAQLLAALNSGPRVVNYYGHGSINLWRGSLLTSSDAASLNNSGSLSFFTLMNCLNGYFQDVTGDSLAEALLKADHGGAVAVWTSSGLTFPNEQALMNLRLYNQLFGALRGKITLGEAIQQAKTATTDTDVRRTWTLLGDPTTRIK